MRIIIKMYVNIKKLKKLIFQIIFKVDKLIRQKIYKIKKQYKIMKVKFK